MSVVREDEELLFDDAELIRWTEHRKLQLRRAVGHAPHLAVSLLAAAGAPPSRLLEMSGREIADPDERAGFLRPATIIVRTSDHPDGRLGAWERNGGLCIETEMSPGVVLIIEGAQANLLIAGSFPEAILVALPGRGVTDLIDHPSFDGLEAVVLDAASDPLNGTTIVSFAVREVAYTFDRA